MRKSLIFIIFALFPWLVAAGQGRLVQSGDSFLEALQKRDSVLIGDQFRYGFHMRRLPSDISIALPDLTKGFMQGDSVEVVRPWTADTLKVYGGKKAPESRDIDFSVVITSFEEGRYHLPPLSVVKEYPNGDRDTSVFESRDLEVFTMPVDTATYVIHDIKGQIKYPVTFEEVLPYILALLALILLAVLIRAFVISRRRKGSGESVSNDPPYIIALRELEKYRSDKYWAPERQKAFYSGVTGALREYIDARYGIDAPEMTTGELFDSLGKTDVPADLFVEMRRLFETADLVKFAKAFASDETNADAVPLAVRFVTSTYQTAPEPAKDIVPEPADGATSSPAGPLSGHNVNEGGTD